MFIFDSAYMLYVFLPTLVLSLAAQFFLSSTYRRWSNVRNTSNMTGQEVGAFLVRNAGLSGVSFEGTPGRLGDHYDPRTHTVRMSPDIATKPTVASMAIVAHELGHAAQHQDQSAMIAMRSFLLPAMTISPNVAMGLILAGLFFQVSDLITLGALFFGVVVVFMLLTLPVEFDASMRGLRMLNEAGLFTTEQDPQWCSNGADRSSHDVCCRRSASSLTIDLLYQFIPRLTPQYTRKAGG
jgi:Zn-dependent membrane protease YugP